MLNNQTRICSRCVKVIPRRSAYRFWGHTKWRTPHVSYLERPRIIDPQKFSGPSESQWRVHLEFRTVSSDVGFPSACSREADFFITKKKSLNSICECCVLYRAHCRRTNKKKSTTASIKKRAGRGGENSTSIYFDTSLRIILLNGTLQRLLRTGKHNELQVSNPLIHKKTSR